MSVLLGDTETQGHAPNYPVISDADFHVSKLYGMLPAETSGDPGCRTLDRVAGQLADPASVFADRPELVQRSSRLSIRQLAERRGLEPGLQLVDVRGAAETAGGTIPGAVEIPLAVLADSLDGLDRDLPVVAYCASGYRSQVAASTLAAAGFRDVSDLLGGYGAWVPSWRATR